MKFHWLVMIYVVYKLTRLMGVCAVDNGELWPTSSVVLHARPSYPKREKGSSESCVIELFYWNAH